MQEIIHYLQNTNTGKHCIHYASQPTSQLMDTLTEQCTPLHCHDHYICRLLGDAQQSTPTPPHGLLSTRYLFIDSRSDPTLLLLRYAPQFNLELGNCKDLV